MARMARKRKRAGPPGRRKQRAKQKRKQPEKPKERVASENQRKTSFRGSVSLPVAGDSTSGSDDSESEPEPAVYQQLLDSFKSKQPKISLMARDSRAEESCQPVENDVEDSVSEREESESDTNNQLEKEDADEGVPAEETEVLPFIDPFCCHFEMELTDDDIAKLSDKSSASASIQQNSDPVLGLVTAATALQSKRSKYQAFDLTSAGIRQRLINHWEKVNFQQTEEKAEFFTPLQQALFSYVNNYQDLLYLQRDSKNCEEIRRLYCLHALNHVLKSRYRVLKNNSLIKQALEDGKEIPECHDQGMTRPKVLILLPFRDSALLVVETMIKLLMSEEKMTVGNKKRFREEYGAGEDEEERQLVKKPDSYYVTFHGNTDDCFRLGIQVQRKAVRLYADFYSSDIIVASPLGLRTVIGAPGDKDRDYDFLSSIEVLTLDQADVFSMQNWDHLLLIFQHLHLQPRDAHGCDFSRLRPWHVNGWSRFYRQTLMFSSLQSPEINSLYNKHCSNYIGKIKMSAEVLHGSISQVAVTVPQVFKKIHCRSASEIADTRFEYFIKEVLPELKGPLMTHTAIFIPSYFDFVRLRNYFKKEEISFAQICEYTTESNVSRARTYFYHGDRHFLLYTERYHFFRRIRIRGIRHLVFYELPQYDEFYFELINSMESGVDQGAEAVRTASRKVDRGSFNATCMALYSQLEGHRLARIVGTVRSKRMLSSKENVHMFVTGDKDK